MGITCSQKREPVLATMITLIVVDDDDEVHDADHAHVGPALQPSA